MSYEWFQEIGRVHSLLPEYNEAYTHLGRVYFRLLDEMTSDSEVLLVGCFAKTDYLLKEKSAGANLRRMVNDMRLRLTKNTEAQKPENFLMDFQALCLFVALLYDVPVPTILESHFVKPCAYRIPTVLKEDYLRVIVDSWDDEYICCSGEVSEKPLQVRYSGEGQLFHIDHSYLSTFLRKGMQLNIISPRKTDEGVLLPELIIVEPDFLVDVSTIASCFESYAESPVVSLFRRMEPSAMSESILMGNMAGELLDRTIHSHFSSDMDAEELSRDYLESAINFFRRNAMGVISVQPGVSFHVEAKCQLLNIHRALNSILPKEVSRFDRDNIVVEPTFFSEMLGLQGRMDMLQTDMSVLVEQKSGNARFAAGETEHDIPSYKEQHYTQMLLYMAIIRYNYRAVYEQNNRELHAFLLYSKYDHPLVGLGFAPELLQKAMMLRNFYVAQEDALANGYPSVLMTMTPDDVNILGISNKFWFDYQRPRIEKVLSNLQGASQLEKAYFERFLNFVSLEHKLSKVGTQTKESSGFASAWHSSLDEKLQCGNILMNLSMREAVSGNSSQVESVVLYYSDESGNFRQGDIVALYSYPIGQIPDLRRAMVFRASISAVSTTTITLHLRTPQKDASIFSIPDDMAWCVEHDFMESSYSGLYRGLYSFMCAPQSRRDLLLLQRCPDIGESIPLRGNYGSFNELQQRVKDARELFLIIGPPGTGKTSFGMLNTLQEELLEENSKVLLVSYTNRSVDEICSKMFPHIDFMRIGGVASSSEVYLDRNFSHIVKQCTTASELKDRVQQVRVVVGTSSSITSHLPLLQMSHFSLCIVDEASQILEPHLLPLFSLCCADGLPCISKFVMIGDHKQLPAVVQQRSRESKVDNPLLQSIGLNDCRNSLFERLLSKYNNNPDLCYMLTHQGRMHRDIAHFPNVAFYGGMLQEVPLGHQLLSSPSPRVRFVDVPTPEDSPSDKVNAMEAEVIVDELMRIWEHTASAFDPQDTVGVIVPYRNQISAIRTILANRLQQLDHPLLQITIDTVERLQGSQRKHIVYGFTVQKQYQLRFLTETTFMEDGLTIDRKLNVAMTRAQEYLVLVGNASLLARVPLYSKLLQYIYTANI